MNSGRDVDQKKKTNVKPEKLPGPAELERKELAQQQQFCLYGALGTSCSSVSALPHLYLMF